jgi:hypothetical protein
LSTDLDLAPSPSSLQLAGTIFYQAVADEAIILLCSYA